MPTQKPRKPSFIVLRDTDIDNGATKADQQLLSSNHNNDTSPLISSIQTESCTQSVPIVDTLDSSTSITSSPVDMSSPHSLHHDENDDTNDYFNNDQDSISNDGIEFNIDGFDDGFSSSQEHDFVSSDNDNNDSDDNDNNLFFDEPLDEEPFMVKTYRRRPGFSAPNNNKRNRSPSDSKDVHDDNSNKVRKLENDTTTDGDEVRKVENVTTTIDSDDNKVRKVENDTTTDADDNKVRKVDTTTDDAPTVEFSISNSLTIPLDSKYDRDDDTQSNSNRSQNSTTTASSTLPSSNESQEKQCESSISPSRSSQEATVPMPLSLDSPIDLHVAYPVPRGTHVTEKFGL
ncbi:uncharacterized protein BX664DRAFT_330637 [Halteromyces radiatus]|uniref:uncharacterized protein n=1 Tax=Halteromyces radiatus TaxID=101107 RepID=UPI00222087E1|nr:uncharacterized protein BX664DRAFT_330637 [Halteromyces radiatus]KAI8093810.1 hypothetical protein BX664DRAFT_330637 [Halteromyces radiatus]